MTYRGKPLSDESIHIYGQSLLAFCHWLEREEKIEKPITTRFKLPRVEKKFVPGLDLVAVCLTGALALFIASLFVSKTKAKPVNSSS